jgi:cytochrome c-type biogenesis protein
MPAYLTIISGASLDELQHGPESQLRRRVMANATAFVCGFSAIFIALGATATFAGRFMAGLRVDAFGLPFGMAQLGGVLVIVMGLHVGGWLPIKALYRVWNMDVNTKRVSLVGAFFVGAGFAFGWSPCIGPILGSILTLAAGSDTVLEGVSLLGAYSAGLAVPFLLSGWSVGFLLRIASRVRVHAKTLERVSGGLLILIGVLMLTGDWNWLNQAATETFGGVTEWVLDAEESLVR